MASGDSDADDEIERLRSMAAKIRAEVASLEADKAQEMADAAQKAFDKFDTNSDGAISLEELKTGLEKNLKVRLLKEKGKSQVPKKRMKKRKKNPQPKS